MDRNVGPEDRVVRIVAAIALAVLIYVGAIEEVGAIIAGIIAAYLLITGLLKMCVFYKMIGLDTTTQEQSYSTTDDRSGL